MPQYNAEQILEFVEGLYKISSLINRTLKKEDFKQDDTGKISELYNKKRDLVVYINKWVQSDTGKEFVENNKARWKQAVDPLINIEKENLKLIDAKVKGLGDDIKKLFKKKSLLIYSKKDKK